MRCRLPRPHRPRHVASVVVPALAIVLLAGCSGGEPSAAPSRKPEPGAAAAASASSSSTVPAPPATPAFPRTTAGRRAFAGHVMELWGYGLRTDQSRPLVAMSAPGRPCRGCAAFARTLAQRRDQGWTVDFPGLVVRRTVERRDGKEVVLRSTVDVPRSDSYNADGSYRSTSPAHSGRTFEVRVREVKGRYRLVAFSLR